MDLKKLISQGSPCEIRKYISRGESETLELKKSTGEWKEIIETISAFANTKGGIIIVGISSKGKATGIQIGEKTIEELTNKIKENTDPKIFPGILVKKIEGKEVILIKVEESRSKPVFAFDRAYKRVGKSTVRATSEEIRRLALEGKKIYWDEQICEEAKLEDIDEEKVRRFLRRARFERRLEIDPDISVREALERLNLIKNSNLTNAALLVFGKTPQRIFLQAEVRCARFKGTEAVKPFIDMKVFGEDIIEQVNKALSFVLEHSLLVAWLVPGKVEREERYEYPPDAIREAIVNAICHRDYESTGNVQLRIFDDRIEVWNPGGLPDPLTLEDLKKRHKSIPRNPLIAKCFFLIKFIEQWGTGTNEMVKRCLEWDLPEPEFEYVTGDLVVTFMKTKLTEEYLDKLGLNERQKKAIKYLKENKEITLSKFRILYPENSDRTLRKDLEDIVKAGIVKPVGEKRGRKYVLK